MAKLHYEITLLVGWVFELRFKGRVQNFAFHFLLYFIGTTYVVK
jgi:hypothetical protein